MNIVAQKQLNNGDWRPYGVVEDGADLLWRAPRRGDDGYVVIIDTKEATPGAYSFGRQDNQPFDGTKVTQAEAEAVTNVIPPFCWDKLRDMM